MNDRPAPVAFVGIGLMGAHMKAQRTDNEEQES